MGAIYINKGSRVRIWRMLAELASPGGADLRLGTRLDTFTGTVVKIYGDHPVNPTHFEIKVKRDDTGAEVFCDVAHIAEVLRTSAQITAAVDAALAGVEPGLGSEVFDDEVSDGDWRAVFTRTVYNLTGPNLGPDEEDIAV